MKRILISTLVLIFIAGGYYLVVTVQEKARQERIYQTQMQSWSGRLAVAGQVVAKNKQDTQARLTLYQIQAEIEDTTPPDRYAVTHVHIQKAIQYYNLALEASDITRARYLLQQFEVEIQQAEEAYK